MSDLVTMQAIAQLVPMGSRVLDLGCGDGALLAYLQQHKACTGYGVEIDDANVLKCAKRGVNVIQLNLDEGLALFGDASFDVVLQIDTLQHLRNAEVMLRETVRQFAAVEIAPRAAEIDRSNQFPADLWRKMGDVGVLGITVPEAYGGADADKLYSVIQFEEIARAGTSGVGYSLHSEIVAPYILHYGTEAQKKKYLPKLASGEMIGAIAMSEPAAGSDLQGIKSTAIEQTDGSYLLNGSKTFITKLSANGARFC